MHFITEPAAPDWEDYIPPSQVNDQSGSQRENQRAVSQLTEHSASWKPTQILEWSKKAVILFLADKRLSDAISGNERRDL